MVKQIASLSLLLGLAVFTGCGDGRASLTGTVTVDGQPASKGLDIQFSPVDGQSPSYASTDENGNYEASFTFQKKGIIAGKHSVRLMPGGGQSSMPVVHGKGADTKAAAPKAFPKSYYSEIEQIEIKPGNNVIDLKLSRE